MRGTTSDTLLAEIRALVDAPAHGDEAPRLDRIEATLTDGYAAALQLEAERLRIERRIAEVAGAFSDGDDAGRAEEMFLLAGRLSDANGDLARLRELLRTLRRRHAAVRAA
jgi:hypothetical protein